MLNCFGFYFTGDHAANVLARRIFSDRWRDKFDKLKQHKNVHTRRNWAHEFTQREIQLKGTTTGSSKRDA